MKGNAISDGTPIYLARGEQINPYQNLGDNFGVNDSDTSIRFIGEKAQEAVQKLLKIMVVGDTGEYSFQELQGGIYERGLNDSDIFFLTNTKGSHLGVGNLNFLKNTNHLEAIGSFGTNITDVLDQYKHLAQIGRENHQAETMLLNIPPNSLLVEIGSGGDYIRLRELDAYAKSRSSRLICQEQVAVAAHSARANIPDIPYIPVPNKPDFLGNVFCGSEKPITVSLQNVISSMSMGGIDEFLRVASMMKAQKICITQSLAFADNSNFFPEGLRPSTTTMGWLTYVMQKAMENNLSHLIGSDKMKDAMTIIPLQAAHTAKLILMELVRRYMQGVAKNEGQLGKNRTTLLERSSILEGNEIKEYFERTSPEIAGKYYEGKINSIFLSPFGVMQTRKDSKVGNGKLKISNMQLVLEMANKFQPVDKDGANGTLFTHVPENAFLTPKGYRSHDTAGFRHNLNDRELSISTKIGAKIGFDYIFQILGAHIGNKMVRSCPKPIHDALYKEFVKGIS